MVRQLKQDPQRAQHSKERALRTYKSLVTACEEKVAILWRCERRARLGSFQLLLEFLGTKDSTGKGSH
eukprot:1926181-Amphidinium_carterae.1